MSKEEDTVLIAKALKAIMDEIYDMYGTAFNDEQADMDDVIKRNTATQRM